MRYFLLGVLLAVFFTVKAQVPDGYYSGTDDLTGSALKSRLNDVIDNHTTITYDAVKEALKSTDEDPENSENVICIYTGWSYGKLDFGNGAYEWNREHVWSKSHGDFGDVPPYGTDLHHLRPEDASVNTSKSNRDFDEGIVEYIDGSGATGCFKDTDVWEPRDAVKGDVARMIFYMAVRYEGEHGELDLQLVDSVNTALDGVSNYGKLSTLLVWNAVDPVDDWERGRNEKVYAIQGNRNPFIDHPEFANLIWNTNIKPEPSNHPINFSTLSVLLKWKDPTGSILPTGYLVRMSTESFDAIETPVDGVIVGDSKFAKNVAYGVEEVRFTGLTAHTTYYFKVFSYVKSVDGINYKVDSSVPQVAKNLD